MRVHVRYIDGRTLSADPDDWSILPSEGLDEVALENAAGTAHSSGHSVYWLYPEGSTWVLGGGSIGYTNPLGETVVGSGNHEYRQIEYMPDLRHDQVKLGAWWPSVERPPHG